MPVKYYNYFFNGVHRRNWSSWVLLHHYHPLYILLYISISIVCRIAFDTASGLYWGLWKSGLIQFLHDFCIISWLLKQVNDAKYWGLISAPNTPLFLFCCCWQTTTESFLWTSSQTHPTQEQHNIPVYETHAPIKSHKKELYCCRRPYQIWSLLHLHPPNPCDGCCDQQCWACHAQTLSVVYFEPWRHGGCCLLHCGTTHASLWNFSDMCLQSQEAGVLSDSS